METDTLTEGGRPDLGAMTRSRLRVQAGHLRAAMHEANLARLMAVRGAWVSADWMILIAVSVLAFDVGGAGGVGLVGAARVLPAAVLGGFVSVASDRIVRPRVLTVTQLMLAVVSFVLVWLAATGATLGVLAAVIAVWSMISSIVRTTTAAMIPQVVRTPAQLIVANAAMSTVLGAGTVLGPALCGILLSVGGVVPALAVPGAMFLLAFVVARTIRTAFQPPRLPAMGPLRRAVEPLLGFPELLRPGTRLVGGLFLLQTVMRGLLNVFVVVLAITVLGGEGHAGTLFAAVGVGGLIGSLAVLGAGPQRGVRWFAVGIALWGLPVVAIGLWPQAILAWLALVVLGTGNAFGDIFGYTLFNGLFRDHVAARAWGAFNSVTDAAVALGSLLAPVLIASLGLSTAMVVTGLLLAAAPVIASPWLRSLERERESGLDPRVVELMGEVDLFAELPPLVLERLARASGVRHLADREYAVREGDVGDFYYVVAEGTLAVRQRGRSVRTLGPGDAFGEIALLEPVPRTASVRSTGLSTLRTIDKHAFVVAVTGHVDADRSAHALIAQLLSEDVVRSMAPLAPALHRADPGEERPSMPAGTPDLYAAPPGYTSADRERWVPEDPALKRSDRDDFARDRARVVHSAALRRLSSTTQVVQPDSDDFVRNRLTHSLEVAQIGREFGAALGCDADVVDAACLAHDLGHPPFGHNGEAVLDELAADIGGFEGNAQTLRVLTRLEAKRAHRDGRSAGLNLTRASLDAATKYPWPRGAHPAGEAKFGFYPDDADVFAWLRTGAPHGDPTRRCIEADVMDWSDDVAYSVHDVEDGIASGRIDPRALRSGPEQGQVLDVALGWYATDLSRDRLGEALERLLELDWIPTEHDRSRQSLAALKDMTSRLVGRFVHTVELATREHHGDGPLTRYAAWLVVPDDIRAEASVLKAVAAHFVMLSDERRVVLDRQRVVVADLVEYFTAHREAMDPMHRHARESAERDGDDVAARRAVIDQVASLSDARALLLHTRLAGG